MYKWVNLTWKKKINSVTRRALSEKWPPSAVAVCFQGKGYPDVCTRQLLSRLCKELRLQALALVDADPHGLEIFLTYKYGSLVRILPYFGGNMCKVLLL